ncbi:MAG: hypothetical protein V6Z81_10645 [Parvularculales bacterium]
MKTLTAAMFICKNPAYLFAKIRHADLLGGFLATFAIVTAFAFSGPAQAGDFKACTPTWSNENNDWVYGCEPVGLLGEIDHVLSVIKPANAGDDVTCFFVDCDAYNEAGKVTYDTQE